VKLQLNRTTYERLFEGFVITDCTVRKKDLVYFILEQAREDRDSFTTTREIQCLDRQGFPAWGNYDFTGMEFMTGGVSHLPTEQFVAVSLNGRVFATGSGDAGLEHDLRGARSAQLKEAGAKPEEYLLRGGITRLRTIGGRVWGCGRGRSVIDRVAKNHWHYHVDLPKGASFLSDDGFRDLDGFSESDIYAVGGLGDVWHWNGSAWSRVPFPSNLELETVCCAGDGQVYIGAESGTVFKGRGNKWKELFRGALTLPFKDMVWHQNAVWCTSDYGLWTITGDKFNTAEVPAGIRVCAGNLSAGDGVLLVAGAYGAAIHDGTAWHRIIDFNNLN
jgi:hypothetical protein